LELAKAIWNMRGDIDVDENGDQDMENADVAGAA